MITKGDFFLGFYRIFSQNIRKEGEESMGRWVVGWLMGALFWSGCAVKYESFEPTAQENQKVKTLQKELLALSPEVDPKEAELIAHEAITYPKQLANSYNLISPPLFHNFLVNAGIRDRGLCYQWAEDLGNHLKTFRPQSLKIRFGVANLGENDEHNAVVVIPKGGSFSEGIVLDPWRESSKLYWVGVGSDPKYKWKER